MVLFDYFLANIPPLLTMSSQSAIISPLLSTEEDNLYIWSVLQNIEMLL